LRIGRIAVALSFNGVTVRRHIQLRSAALRRRLTRPVHKPSFYTALDRRTEAWKRLVALHGTGSELYPEFAKLSLRGLAEAAGVAMPELLDGPVSTEELDFDRYGDSFVIKPNWGAASRGVMVLRRVGDDRYENLMDRSILTSSDVRARLAADVGASGRGSSEELVVEASVAVGGERPQEWKLFAFYGEIGLVQQNDRSHEVVHTKMYSGTWEDAGRIRTDRVLSSVLAPPADPQALIDAAVKISRQVPTGFMRVDLFESPGGGVVLGEVCLIPGGDLYFRKGLDRRLGQMWDEANVRLLEERRPLIP
jgi:hypothetical protein